MTKETPNSKLLDLMLKPEDIRTNTDPDSNLNTQIVTALSAIVATGVLIGAVFAGRLELAARGGLAIFLLNLLWDFIVVFIKMASVGSIALVLSILLFGPFLVLYFITLMEWWGKHD